MLKNVKERTDYIYNPDNWEEITCINDYDLKIFKLKGFPFIDIRMKWVSVFYDVDFNVSYGKGRYTSIGTYKINDKGELVSIYQYTTNQIIKYMTEHRDEVE